ncbi:uromodulin-like [Carassius auratus]|uniref:Uromodulin-like n=1 Tax=Carassius auratus TaxID=7957 RepID=A0A6P6N2Q3_CARAU|nr:uromodulin-like [Carassius auratus]
MCDCEVNWNGWYRLFIQDQSVQMPDTCVEEYSCGTDAPLWLKGGHPTVEDGMVTRDVCGHYDNNCCSFLSNPINVKACPGDYYVYEFVKPAFCFLAYCADVTNINSTYTVTTTIMTAVPPVDPCYNYNVLDDPWRATNNQYTSEIMCDCEVSWDGWYRLFIQDQSVQMPDTCVDMLSCGTHAPLWLTGGHPTVEDGVVTRDVCGHWDNDCCYFQSNPIKVKACSGNYFVYEFVKPAFCSLAYCAAVFNTTYTTVTPKKTSTTATTNLDYTGNVLC